MILQQLRKKCEENLNIVMGETKIAFFIKIKNDIV